MSSDQTANTDNKTSQDEPVVEPKAEITFFESKLFRWISLFLYLGGISGLGMVLSFYYLFFFDSSMPDIYLKFPISIGGEPVQKVQEYK